MPGGGAGRHRDVPPTRGSRDRRRAAAPAGRRTTSRPPRTRCRCGPRACRRTRDGRGNPARLLLGLLEVVAARHEHDDLRHGGAHLVPRGLAARLAVLGEHGRTADRRDHAGHPMPGGERRVGPFEREDAHRRQPLGGGFHSLDAVAKRRHQHGRGSTRSSAFADRADRGDHLVERVGIERDDRRVGRPELVERLLDLPGRHGADAAEILREHDIGLLAAQQVDVELVERLAGADLRPHGVVDLPRRLDVSLGERAAADDRLRDVAAGGKSHSSVTPTRSSPSPRAKTISVADGSKDAIFIEEAPPGGRPTLAVPPDPSARGRRRPRRAPGDRT